MVTRVPSVHLRQLAYLRAVAQRGSVTRAAAALSVSQPALSQGLAELERRLGTPLLEAAGRGRRLTAAGLEVLAFAERTLADAAELQARLRADAAGEGGTLRVGMIDAASLYLLPGVIRAYRVAHPGVALQVRVATSGELVAGLRAFELDLAFAVGPPDEDLDAVAVAREPLVLCGPPGAGRGSPPADADWALYPAGSRTRALVDAALARGGVRRRVVVESPNPEVLRQLVALGLGWSVLPEAVVAASEEPLALGASVAERTVYGLRRRSAGPDARAGAFLEAALAVGRGGSERGSD